MKPSLQLAASLLAGLAACTSAPDGPPAASPSVEPLQPPVVRELCRTQAGDLCNCGGKKCLQRPGADPPCVCPSTCKACTGCDEWQSTACHGTCDAGRGPCEVVEEKTTNGQHLRRYGCLGTCEAGECAGCTIQPGPP